MQRSRVLFAIFLCLLWVAALPAQTQNQQPSGGSMDGMDMSKPAGTAPAAGSAKPMDMSHCMMDMSSSGGKQMDMGSGSDSKSMNMGGCMGMMHGAMKPANAAPIPPGVLRVMFGEKSTDWTPAKLAPLAHVNVTVHNGHTKADEVYSGVPVIALLTPLGVSDKPHGGNLRFYVVAMGSDGYEAVYSIGEVMPDLSSGTVIVADLENGKPLAGDGPLKIVGTGDKGAARRVRNLVAIKVLAAE
ncbi:MAG: hypothetical protein ABSF23_08595 [Terracidiphilus sp.]|jgi:hypothetical protein